MNCAYDPPNKWHALEKLDWELEMMIEQRAIFVAAHPELLRLPLTAAESLPSRLPATR